MLCSCAVPVIVVCFINSVTKKWQELIFYYYSTHAETETRRVPNNSLMIHCTLISFVVIWLDNSINFSHAFVTYMYYRFISYMHVLKFLCYGDHAHVQNILFALCMHYVMWVVIVNLSSCLQSQPVINKIFRWKFRLYFIVVYAVCIAVWVSLGRDQGTTTNTDHNTVRNAYTYGATTTQLTFPSQCCTLYHLSLLRYS